MSKQSVYEKRGASFSKDDVHKAIRHLDKGLFPNAFCKILPDIAGKDEGYCNIMHADTAGTKTSLAYLYWKETRDLTVWDGVVQDAIVMNIDDMACIGCVNDIILSSTVGRNKHIIPGEVVERIILASRLFINQMRNFDIDLHLAGGETADVGDIVRTVDVGITSFGRLKREDLIVNQIRAGDVVVGLSSSGKAIYENEYNSGIGSNGLTSARHDLLRKQYAENYPESFDPNSDRQYVYTGSRNLTDEVEIQGTGTFLFGKIILSPTRTYLPVIKTILQRKIPIHGMIHCTGGGQTKVLKFLENKKVIKDQLFEIPPLFALIEAESPANRKEMYQVFNMGHRMEIYTGEKHAEKLISIAKEFQVEAKVVGHVEEGKRNEVVIRDNLGEYSYLGN